MDYYIMSGDTVTAKQESGKLIVINEALLPLFLKRVHNADMWLETRAIDAHRANSRLLKKALRLKERDDISTVIHVNAATITDNYWIKPINSDLTYKDVRFTDDYFSALALTGTYDSFNDAANSKQSRTPELTNIGSFEKCWRLINGKWWMYKTATPAELFSELFVSRLGTELNLNMAVYENDDGYIKTLDFTDGGQINFEPASAFMGDNEDYEDVVTRIYDLCPSAIPDYIRMLFLDTVIVNPDRHTANFGLLRSIKTGDLLRFAPIFDHNMALISRGYPKAPTKSDLLIHLFNDLLDEHPIFRNYLPDIDEAIIRSIIADIGMDVKEDDIVNLILQRYALIR